MNGDMPGNVSDSACESAFPYSGFPVLKIFWQSVLVQEPFELFPFEPVLGMVGRLRHSVDSAGADHPFPKHLFDIGKGEGRIADRRAIDSQLDEAEFVTALLKKVGRTSPD